MIRHILWDMDGTLFDTYPAVTYAISRTLSELGHPVALNVIDSLARRSLDACVDALAQRFQLDPSLVRRRSAEIYRCVPAANQLPFPGARDVCAWVVAHHGLNIILTQRTLASTRALLDAHALTALVADVLSTEQGFPGKPDGALALAALTRHALRPSETLLVGHREIDLRAGQAAGVRTCLFGPAKVAVPADLQVDDYHQLLAFLDRNTSDA
jgi:phosphoglycolate phosphatase-like HAD superfamily hydrolase